MMQDYLPADAALDEPQERTGERRAAGASAHENAARDSEDIRRMHPDELVDVYAGLVKNTGQDLLHQLQCPVDLEDLIGWGFQGLLEAHQRFDPDMEVNFASFAFYRVRGAMYDGLRAAGWAVRGTAIQLRDTIAINDYLESNMLADAGAPQAKTFADAVNYLDRMVGDCVTICLVQHNHLELVSETEPANQRHNLERDELGTALNAAVARLSDIERDVLVRYHVHDEPMSDIGADLGYSKSWVSRVNARAIDKVKKYLYEQGDDWELYMTRV